MPKQDTHVRVVREWCVSLGVLTAISISRQEAEMKLAAYVPMLMHDFTDAAFTAESLHDVARQCMKGFPTYPELAALLSAWWREHRPYVALPPPPPPPERPPPTPEEIEHVHRLTQEVVASLRASEMAKAADRQAQLDALGVKPRPLARYLTREQLDAAKGKPQ